jgi:hypothetical protein
MTINTMELDFKDVVETGATALDASANAAPELTSETAPHRQIAL